MCEGQMNATALCASMYFKFEQEPKKNGLWAGFGPRATIWEGLI